MIRRARVLRFPDWAERLAAFIESRRNAPFAWGSNDCCLFMADGVLAQTGQDRAAPWRGRYRTEAEAEAILAGAGGLLGVLRDAHQMAGAAEIPPSLAQRGDSALFLVGNQLTTGIVLGEMAAAPGLRGLEFVPVVTATHAWVT